MKYQMKALIFAVLLGARLAGVVVLTPDGVVSRYFLGDVPAVDLKQAIRDAGTAKVGPAPGAIANGALRVRRR